jgi:hypothetical protein
MLTVQLDTLVMIATGVLRVQTMVAWVMIPTVCREYVMCPSLTLLVNTVMELETHVYQDAPPMPTALNSTLFVEMVEVLISVAALNLPNAPVATSVTHRITSARRIWAATTITRTASRRYVTNLPTGHTPPVNTAMLPTEKTVFQDALITACALNFILSVEVEGMTTGADAIPIMIVLA